MFHSVCPSSVVRSLNSLERRASGRGSERASAVENSNFVFLRKTSHDFYFAASVKNTAVAVGRSVALGPWSLSQRPRAAFAPSRLSASPPLPTPPTGKEGRFRESARQPIQQYGTDNTTLDVDQERKDRIIGKKGEITGEGGRL